MKEYKSTFRDIIADKFGDWWVKKTNYGGGNVGMPHSELVMDIGEIIEDAIRGHERPMPEAGEYHLTEEGPKKLRDSMDQ
jgi:hypothetical protein